MISFDQDSKNGFTHTVRNPKAFQKVCTGESTDAASEKPSE